jgi:hypothetical protein
MTAEEMLFDLIQQIAVHMDKGPADFAFQMEMIPAFYCVYVLVTGAFALIQHVFADLSPDRQLLQMPVDGGLPDDFFGILKMTHYLIDSNMRAPKGLHVIKDALSLPGVIICRTFRHRPYRTIINWKRQYENECYFQFNTPAGSSGQKREFSVYHN